MSGAYQGVKDRDSLDALLKVQPGSTVEITYFLPVRAKGVVPQRRTESFTVKEVAWDRGRKEAGDVRKLFGSFPNLNDRMGVIYVYTGGKSTYHNKVVCVF